MCSLQNINHTDFVERNMAIEASSERMKGKMIYSTGGTR